MNIVNSPPTALADLLQKTLYCSRYAKRALETDHRLLNWLQESYHDGRMEEVDGPFDLGGGRADCVIGGGNIVPLQEALGEALAGLQHRRRPRRPEDPQAALRS